MEKLLLIVLLVMGYCSIGRITYTKLFNVGISLPIGETSQAIYGFCN